MARYAAEVNRTAGAGLTVGSVVADGTTPHRGKLYDLVMGSEATPADNAFNWIVGRVTAAGTSTAVTAIALDPADAAALADVGENHTVEPTYTANQTLLSISLNQRATFRWVAYPGGELVYPATAANGLGVKTPTASAVVVSATLHFDEQ